MMLFGFRRLALRMLLLLAAFGALALGACSGGDVGDDPSGADGSGADGAGADSGSGTGGDGANDAGAGSGTGSASGSGGGVTIPENGPRVATVRPVLDLAPAPGLAGPALRVDLDMSGRPSSEVSEPGYVAWPITAGATASKIIEGVTFTFAKAGSNGTELNATWSKAAVQAPNYARLAGDGITVTDGAAGSQIRLTISDLPAGKHSLLTFHNVPGASGAGKVSVQVNGVVQTSNLEESQNALSNSAAPSSYVTFDAAAGADVVLLFTSTASLVINGFLLDSANITAQATDPVPFDGDDHVDADDGHLELGWTPAAGAASHDVYVGTDPNRVQAATHDSPEFQGNQTTETFTLSGLHNIAHYFWRIDEISGDGAVTRGAVWYFRPRHDSFPGAEGYGRYAVGGRGGVVVHVTNLNDSGAGSLRDAVTTDRGPRTIVFDVAGVIQLNSRLVLNQNYVTVAGHTAPGKGIVIRSAPFGIAGVTDDQVRHLRVRLGAGTTFDGMGLTGANHSIIDHASISWTIDEAFSSRNGRNITLQRSLISECLNVANHLNYPAGTKHGYAASIGGDIGSFHHNLLAHCEGRNWSLAGGLDPNGYFSGRLDIFDNVVYNWGGRTTDGGAHEVNFVNNYYRPGPASTIFSALKADYDSFPGTQQYYCEGNVMPGKFTASEQNKACVKGYGNPNGYSPFVNERWFPPYAEIHPADVAFKNVLSDVGNSSPVFDDHDVRVVKETLNGTTTYTGSKSGVKGLPDTEADVGGYESYPTTNRESGWDTDGDGLPNFWETASGLDTNSADGDFTEANTDFDEDGYTELEEYLAFAAAPHYVVGSGEAVAIDASKLFAGFASNPVYTAQANGGTAAVSGKTVTFTPSGCGLTRVVLAVQDGAGTTMEREVLVFVVPASGACRAR